MISLLKSYKTFLINTYTMKSQRFYACRAE